MALRKMTLAVWLVALCFPALVVCQSRGEASFRGQNNGYANERSYAQQSYQDPLQYYQHQTQSQSQPYSNPAYSSQAQSISHFPPLPQPQPRPQNYDTNFQQSQGQSYNQPIPQYYQPAPGRPISPLPAIPQTYNNNYNNNDRVSSQPSSNLDSRVSEDESSTQQPGNFFVSRPTKKGPKIPPPTRKPPVVERFDERDSSVVKRNLQYDSELANSMEIFAIKLLSNFNDQLNQDNFMISPFSIYHLLVLIAEGAKGNTYNEINQELTMIDLPRTRDFQQYLHVVLNQSTADVVLKKFAMMVTDKVRPVKLEYESLIEKVYEADVMPVNFREVDKTLSLINGEVSRLTEGQIPDTVSREDLFKAQLILISGLFFKGKWMNVFNSTFTKREAFHDTSMNRVGEVNMMFQRGPFAYAAVGDLGCHILELPYAEKPASRNDAPGGSGLSMILVLPRKGLSLDAAISNVYQHGMKRIYRELRNAKTEYEDDEIEVHLPRFEINTSLNVKEALDAMGIKDVFDQSRADLSGINSQYYVSTMIHKTKISVDEQGTTAAAVTTSIFANKATPPKFHANKPFLFFIVDKLTNLILFSGQYATPELY